MVFYSHYVHLGFQYFIFVPDMSVFDSLMSFRKFGSLYFILISDTLFAVFHIH